MPARLSANSLRMSEAPASSARMARRPVPADAPAVATDFLQIWRNADKIVYSRTLSSVSSARTRLERNFDVDAVRTMKSTAGRDINVGGSTLAAQAIAAGLIDEFRLYVVPIILGGGKRCLHGIAQNSGVDAPTPFKIGQKLARSLNDARGDNRGGTDRERHGGAVDERFGHGRDFSESGTGPSRPALS